MSEADKFDVRLIITGNQKLATIMQVLDGEAKLVKCEPIQHAEPTSVPPPKVVHRRRVSSRTVIPGLTTDGLLLNVAAGGKEITKEQVQKAFVEKSYAITSAGSTISRAIQSGRLVEVRPNVYKIAPKAAGANGATLVR